MCVFCPRGVGLPGALFGGRQDAGVWQYRGRYDTMTTRRTDRMYRRALHQSNEYILTKTTTAWWHPSLRGSPRATSRLCPGGDVTRLCRPCGSVRSFPPPRVCDSRRSVISPFRQSRQRSWPASVPGGAFLMMRSMRAVSAGRRRRSRQPHAGMSPDSGSL